MEPQGRCSPNLCPLFFKVNSFEICFLFILPLSQFLEGTWSGYFMSGDWAPNKRHDCIRSGVWPAAPGGCQALACHGFQSPAWTDTSKGCRWEMGVSLSGKQWAGLIRRRVAMGLMFRVDHEPWSSASFSCLCSTHSAHTLPLHPPPLLIPSTPCVFLKAKQINSVLHGIKTDNTESAVYNIPNLFRILKLKFQSSAFMKQCCSFSLERCRKRATKWQ